MVESPQVIGDGDNESSAAPLFFGAMMSRVTVVRLYRGAACIKRCERQHVAYRRKGAGITSLQPLGCLEIQSLGCLEKLASVFSRAPRLCASHGCTSRGWSEIHHWSANEQSAAIDEGHSRLTVSRRAHTIGNLET
jgi:hypothetical protein